ncbi:response regulator [Legionella spiritensis]|uniref:response regulator n=1 Tax=Legionella spiritensis TaxID=452 RepID=UPI000F82E9F4|nr:response regulator [Legionella spiritensis]
MDDKINDIGILYVEDDEIDIRHLLREFRKINPSIHIDVVHNGMEALEKLKGERNKSQSEVVPKAILLDINLPQMSGIDFLKKLRSDPRFRATVVFLITSFYTTQDKIAVRDLNVSGCIIKPLQHTDAINLLWCMNSDLQSAELFF